jgi:hypothetical protein
MSNGPERQPEPTAIAPPIAAPRATDIAVSDQELARLIGWPMRRPFEGRTRELAADAREVFREQARPWGRVVHVRIAAVDTERVRLGIGDALTGPRLARLVNSAGAELLTAFAATAGQRIADYANRCWADNQPDLAFVLSALSSAFIEQMLLHTHQQLCEWARQHGWGVLPPMSPGNDGWDLAGQHELYRLLQNDPHRCGEMPIQILPSGGLWPAQSQLAAFALTRYPGRVAAYAASQPCTRCSLRHCAFRRVEQITTPG